MFPKFDKKIKRIKVKMEISLWYQVKSSLKHIRKGQYNYKLIEHVKYELIKFRQGINCYKTVGRIKPADISHRQHLCF